MMTIDEGRERRGVVGGRERERERESGKREKVRETGTHQSHNITSTCCSSRYFLLLSSTSV